MENIHKKKLNKKIKIKISTEGLGTPFVKQLKSFNCTWDNCEFFINEEIAECDFWVVYGGLWGKENVLVCKENTLLITTEPPSVKKYQKKFLNQFGAIIGCDRSIKHPNIHHQQQSLPWWVGHKLKSTNEDDVIIEKTYDELKLINIEKKDKLISIIVSNKKFTKGHRERLEFVKKLQREFDNTIDIFGTGFNMIEDKWDAIAPYKYHIVIENSSYKDYFTEKLSDAFLGQSYPIYYGCPNIYDYFSQNALSQIDINKPDEATKIIKKIIQSDQYENSVNHIKNAKDLILEKYQIFPMLNEYVNTYISDKEKKIVTLKPEKKSNMKKLIRKLIKITLKIFKKN